MPNGQFLTSRPSARGSRRRLSPQSFHGVTKHLHHELFGHGSVTDQQAVEQRTKQQVGRDVGRHVRPDSALLLRSTDDSGGSEAARIEQALEQFGAEVCVVLRLADEGRQELAGQTVQRPSRITELTHDRAPWLATSREWDGGRVHFCQDFHQQ